MCNTKSCWTCPLILQSNLKLIIPRMDRQTDARSRSRQYIDRAKDWGNEYENAVTSRIVCCLPKGRQQLQNFEESKIFEQTSIKNSRICSGFKCESLREMKNFNVIGVDKSHKTRQHTHIRRLSRQEMLINFLVRIYLLIHLY